MRTTKEIDIVWGILIILTIMTYAFGKLGLNGTGIVAVLLLSIIIKGSMIIRDFMDLRGVSLLWRIIMYGWLWLISFLIGIAYLLSI
jgi:cytochrome c oxidase subunit IV